MIIDKNKPSLKSTLKSTDTEETLDLMFYRPIGYCWALVFKKLGIHPNAVTIVSIILGVAAGVFFYFADIYYNLIGMFLLIWANSYDSADGQLARMTGKKSRVGRILDGMAGDFWFISIYIALCLRMMPEWHYWIWVLAALAGYSHRKQASMADYYRNVHLYFLKGEAESELDSSRQQQASFRKLSWSGNVLMKIYHYIYGQYTASQEKSSPRFQRFFTRMRKIYGNDVPREVAREFRRGSKPLMKYTNILSFNTRVMVLFISLFINLPWIYFIFELTVLNILLVYMVNKHESLCRKLNLQLKPKGSEK